jgi:hypothetical protein
MFAEFVAGFIVAILVGVVAENSARVLGATRLVNETTDPVVFAHPKSPNPTVVPILLPQGRIDVSVGIEGRNKIVSMA